MTTLVERENGNVEKIELSDGDLRVLHLGDFNCLVGAGTANSFTRDGYYNDARATPAVREQDP